MNAIGMLFQQIQAPKMSVTKQTTSEDNASLFQVLLSNETLDEPNLGILLKNREGNSEGELVDIDTLPLDVKMYLYSMLTDSGHQENNAISDETEKEITTLINELFPDKITDLQEGNPIINQVHLDTVDITSIQKQFAEVFAKVEAILSQIGNQQEITKAAPKLLQLLQQWSTLERKLANKTGLENSLSSLKSEGAKEHIIWRELVQAFEKRNQLVTKQQYNSDAKVTSTDVAKWLGRAMDNHAVTDKVIGQNTMVSSTLPISRLEQYVIYVNQTQSTQSADNQLIEQFQKVMKSSRFMAMPNGTNQLSISLRPENLGEMMVRLTQVNGEMTVKILVTSQAAKEMLESNMHQLRNMFSPQQVVVEKQELNVQQSQDIHKESKEDQLMDHEQDQSQESDQNENQHTDEDFATQFHELLMNEKV